MTCPDRRRPCRGRCRRGAKCQPQPASTRPHARTSVPPPSPCRGGRGHTRACRGIQCSNPSLLTGKYRGELGGGGEGERPCTVQGRSRVTQGLVGVNAALSLPFLQTNTGRGREGTRAKAASTTQQNKSIHQTPPPPLHGPARLISTHPGVPLLSSRVKEALMLQLIRKTHHKHLQ